MIDQIVAAIPSVIHAGVLFLVFWLVGKGVSRVINSFGKIEDTDAELVLLLSKMAGRAVLGIGIITMLGTFGINVGAIVASLGLTGFAIGFALKDIISNALSGVLILFYKSFEKGDYIETSGAKGLVKETDMRYTVLKVDDDTEIFIPNSLLSSQVITVVKNLEGKRNLRAKSLTKEDDSYLL